jgi:hypothetical protein
VSLRRRRRFAELVQRQLDLFALDESDLFAELDAAERAYDAADRDGAEDAYADLQLIRDAGAERLVDVRDAYAATLDDGTRDDYAHAFRRAASKRFPRLTGLL